jgi:hypothetical protein
LIISNDNQSNLKYRKRLSIIFLSNIAQPYYNRRPEKNNKVATKRQTTARQTNYSFRQNNVFSGTIIDLSTEKKTLKKYLEDNPSVELLFQTNLLTDKLLADELLLHTYITRILSEAKNGLYSSTAITTIIKMKSQQPSCRSLRTMTKQRKSLVYSLKQSALMDLYFADAHELTVLAFQQLFC